MTLDYYLAMLADTERIDAFGAALHEVVRPDDVVVDVGCGFGTYAMMAAHAGARRVFGVDRDDVIEHARAIEAERQRGDGARVELFRGDAKDVELPERASVVVFENFSVTPLIAATTRMLRDVAVRWTQPGFRTVPERVSLYVAPVESAACRAMVDPGPAARWGIPGTVLRGLGGNGVLSRPGANLRLLSVAQEVGAWSPCELPFVATRSGTFEVTVDGDLDGLVLWHDLHLSPNARYSNHPELPGPRSWGQAVLPVDAPWAVHVGDRVAYEVRYDRDFWRWRVRLDTRDGRSRSHGGNTFASLPIGEETLLRSQPTHVPQLSTDGARLARVLALADGERSVAAIASAVGEHDSRAAAIELVLHDLEGHTR